MNIQTGKWKEKYMKTHLQKKSQMFNLTHLVRRVKNVIELVVFGRNCHQPIANVFLCKGIVVCAGQNYCSEMRISYRRNRNKSSS